MHGTTIPAAPDLDAVAALRSRLWEAEYRPVPVYNIDQRVTSPGKQPMGKGWQNAARQDPPGCVSRPPEREARNTGILCDGLRAVDIDVDDPDLADRLHKLAVAMLGEAPTRSRSNTRRVLLVYRAAEGEPRKREVKGDSGLIEVLGHGQQFVGFGRHPSGVLLQWSPSPLDTIPRADLPAITEAALSAFLDAAGGMLGAEPPAGPRETTEAAEAPHIPSALGPSADPLDVTAALAAIPNPGRNWDRWSRIGLATWHATSGSPEGFAAWSAWSARATDGIHSPASCRTAWEGFHRSPPGEIGAGSLFHMAREALPGWRKPTDITRNAEGWPETSMAPIPLPDGLPPVASFTDDLLPDAFRAWVMDIANRMQCPSDFPAVAAIVTASAVIGRQMGIHPKRRDDWLVVPNLWGAVVGRPSLMKTPAIAEARKILSRLEIEARKKYEREVAEYELNGSIAKLVAKERKNSAARSIKKAMEAGDDPEKAARAAMGADDEDIKPPVRRRYVTQDPTVEKLGELLIETPRGMLLFRDELIGLLRSMDKDGHENDRAFYLEAWNGNGAYTYDRIGRGTIEIDAACVSLMGGIQPGPLRAYIAQANAGGAGDDGLLQRMQLLVWPDRGDDWRNIDEWPDTTAKTRAYSVFERLDQIGDPTSTEIPTIRFDDAGQDAFNAWREVFERRFYAEDMPPALEAHLTKYRSLVPSLALIFHLIDTPDAPAVGARHVSRAIRWTEYLESHARRLYAQILDPGMVAALLLAGRLPELPETFTARDVYRRGWAGLDRAATERALEVLADFHHVAVKTETTGGRPSAIYRKNFHETPKPETDKTAKSGPSGAFVSFGSDPNGGWSEIFSDEVEL
ncbi:DUF3987 domain-containing protein [Acidiphilium multivorum]|uniref:DUF3987 domain-containing protein n=1 Tax=Acidiphilium multivorum TaxID=62140 RepID=UPI001B8C0225|nr:DUF3987 domain-containing protein [Acidiphilium multivorum]MBS3022814.1 DUF3987 domain-containing protein [Acidiphilium multivorum]